MTVDEYINSFPKDIKAILKEVRAVIRKSAPEAEERMAYRMPAYRINGRPLVYFAGYNTHVGLYATPSGHSRFARELSGYKTGKGSVQFPVDEPMPLDLISRIVKFRVEENKRKNPGKSKPQIKGAK